MRSVKKERPQHSYSGERWRTNHTNKKYLSIDFKGRCAYCDDRDFYCGGQRNFHVEHFAPKEKFPELQFEYENLLYSCPYCNGAKSDTWPSNDSSVNIVDDEGFINPCSEDYDEHLERAPDGKIVPRTKLGRYMIKELKLFLYRHELFFNIEQVEKKMEQLKADVEMEKAAGKDTSAKQDAIKSLQDDFFKYYSDWQTLKP